MDSILKCSDGSRGEIDASAASMFPVSWTASRVWWREAPTREQGSGDADPGIKKSLSAQTTRRSNLALAGRRFNRIFTDSYNKFIRLTLKEWENRN